MYYEIRCPPANGSLLMQFLSRNANVSETNLDWNQCENKDSNHVKKRENVHSAIENLGFEKSVYFFLLKG